VKGYSFADWEGGILVASFRGIGWAANNNCTQQKVVPIRVSGLLPLTESENSGWQKRTLELYEQFNPSLYRYLRSLGVSSDEAEDLIQETFLRLAGHLRESNNDSNLRSWLFQVAHNLSMDVHRARRQDQSISDLDDETKDEMADPNSDPELRYLKKEQFRRLKALMATLTPQQRNSILLRAEGLRYWEIASVLGVSEQRATFLVKRGLLRLAKGL
jgi:RNA polymerase sigma-70 factor, ECF subfamily